MRSQGKLEHVAETIFCVAYGLNGYPKITHSILIPFLMTNYKCSLRALTSLLYGTSYNALLNKWRVCVHNYYNGKFDPASILLEHLPIVSEFNANSQLQYRSKLDEISQATDSNVAMRHVLGQISFTFLTPVHTNTLHVNVPIFQLSSIFTSLNFHQRVALVLQIAHCIHQISTHCQFRVCGQFVMDLKCHKAIIGEPVILEGTQQSLCASIIGVKTPRHNYNYARNVKQYICRRLAVLRNASYDPHILAPFCKLAKQFYRHSFKTTFEYSKTRLVAHNLTPANIFVAFEGIFFFKKKIVLFVFDHETRSISSFFFSLIGDYPVVAQIIGWDRAEVLPMEIARCNVPGWLWNDINPSPNGSLINKPCTNVFHDILRISFIDKMEQLQPGYFSDVVMSQTLHFGLLSRLASKGLNLTKTEDRSFYDNAFACISK